MARGRSRRKFAVYYDGQCAMCTAAMGSVQASEKAQALES